VVFIELSDLVRCVVTPENIRAIKLRIFAENAVKRNGVIVDQSPINLKQRAQASPYQQNIPDFSQ
jgi:hypothetical protein